MKVTVDQEKCCAGGNCVMLAPDVFDQRDSDGVVVLLADTPPEHLHDAVREAADMCPAACITLDESARGGSTLGGDAAGEGKRNDNV